VARFGVDCANVLKKQMCECSKVKPEFHPEWEAKHSRRKRSPAEDDDDRIVGGYTADSNKPWIAKLWLVKGEFLCGSSIINKRYLLTASHCTCKILDCDKGKPLYKPSEEFKAYLGINKMETQIDVSDMKGNPKYEYGVEDVISHPDYKTSSDIALIKLDRDIEFVPGVLEPICLPAADDKSDVSQKDNLLDMYVSGWGKTSSDCTTDEFGPIKNLKCKLPFTYKEENLHECANVRSPSSKIEECKAFKKVNKADYPAAPGDSIVITDGTKNTTCYSFDKGEHGWCQAIETDDEFDDNWGYCKPSCKIQVATDRLAQQLQETKLEVLPMKVCKNLIVAGKYNFVGKNELCAGKKKFFKKIKMFTRAGDGFKFTGEVTNYLGLNDDGNYPYEYYISGTDSCNGDSGGPVYRWVDGVPTLIAVVARGWGSGDSDGCAELNFPGIYTRTAKFLDWIQENAADGNC